MAIRDYFTHTQEDCPNHSWTGLNLEPEVGDVPALAADLADAIMKLRCAPHQYEAWKECSSNGTPLPPTVSAAMRVLVGEVFGLPNENQPPQDHLEGYVAESLWYFLSIQHPHGLPAVKIEKPGFKAIDPGGDGLIVHQREDDSLMFRLWEIKKAPTTGIKPTISRACNQLDEKALSYLARYSAVGQEYEPPLSTLYEHLTTFWLEARDEASAGVSVTTSATPAPPGCFDKLPDQFPQFCEPSRLRGLLTALDDFPVFATLVKEEVWKGL